MNAPLLVELLTEELPPKALDLLGRAFAEGIHKGLAARDLVEDRADLLQVFASPRRLGLLLADVRSLAPERSFEQKLMPAHLGFDAASQPSPALRKKLDALGLAFDAAKIVREVPASAGEGAVGKGKAPEMLVYRGMRPGASLAAGLQAALEESIAALPIPKMMSYQLADGVTTVHFVRPAHRLLALHGKEVVPVQVLGLQAGRETAGHRFHAPGSLSIGHAQDYEQRLREHGKVIASSGKRRQRIVDGLLASANRIGAQAVMPDTLVDEVAALVEWPFVYESGFDAAFLAVPQNS